MTNNRRNTDRLLTCLAVGVQTRDNEQLGLVRDASSTGALLFTQTELALDDTVKLAIRVELEGIPDIEVIGKIVRVERKADGFWHYRMGVVFEPRRDDLAPVFKALADRQEKLYGPPG